MRVVEKGVRVQIRKGFEGSQGARGTLWQQPAHALHIVGLQSSTLVEPPASVRSLCMHW